MQITLIVILGASLFSMTANTWRVFNSSNKFGRLFHLMVALTSAYFVAIFFLALHEIIPSDTFGPTYARPATIIMLGLLGAAAIAYPNVPRK